MKLIEPITVNAANLTSSTVPITETEWTAGTYATGVQRYVGIDLYEVAATPDTTDEPTAGAAKATPTWFRVGTINRFAAFDGIANRPSAVASGSMQWIIQTTGYVTGFALFNLEGESVTVRFRNSSAAIIFEQSWSLTGRGIPTTWLEWFTAPFDQTFQVAVTDAPSTLSPEVEILIDGGSNPASVGEIFLGTVQILGTTTYGTSIEIEDFTTRERDAFGNFVIRERLSTSIVSYTVVVEKSRMQFVDRLLRSRLAKPTVYVGDENWPTTIVAGFPRNIQTVPVAPSISEMLFEVEGLI